MLWTLDLVTLILYPHEDDKRLLATLTTLSPKDPPFIVYFVLDGFGLSPPDVDGDILLLLFGVGNDPSLRAVR